MPAYSPAPPPPQSLQPGGVFYSFGSMNWLSQVETLEIIPAVVPQAGAQCALIQGVAAFSPGPRSVTYETEFDAAPNAVSVSLQGAMRDVDSEYQTIDSNTAFLQTNSKTVQGITALFLRLIVNSITVGAATKLVGKISV